MTSTHTMPLPPAAPSPKGNGKPLNIILAVLGGLVILTVLIGTARSALGSLNRNHFTQTASTDGITSLDISASSGSFDLVFADTDQATLQGESTAGYNWELRREGNQLVVDSPNSWGDFCLFGCGFEENQATLILPESLNNGTLEADFELSAGGFDAMGDFKDLDIEVGAGALDFTGAAENAQIRIGAGRADVALDNVSQAAFEVSAGRLTGTLTGEAPKNIEADVSAGSLDLELPRGSYDVRQNAEAGELRNSLATDPASPNKITIGISAGSAVLHSAGSANGAVDD